MYHLTLRASALRVRGLIVKVKQGCLTTPLRLLSTQFLPRDSLSGNLAALIESPAFRERAFRTRAVDKGE